MPRAASSSSSDSPAAVAKATRKGSWRIVTLRAEVRTTDSAAPTSKDAAGSPKSLLTTAYEWSRPKPGPGAKRIRTISGAIAVTATDPWALWNRRVGPSRRGAGIEPSDAHPACSETAPRRTVRTARPARRTLGTGTSEGWGQDSNRMRACLRQKSSYATTAPTASRGTTSSSPMRPARRIRSTAARSSLFAGAANRPTSPSATAATTRWASSRSARPTSYHRPSRSPEDAPSPHERHPPPPDLAPGTIRDRRARTGGDPLRGFPRRGGAAALAGTAPGPHRLRRFAVSVLLGLRRQPAAREPRRGRSRGPAHAGGPCRYARLPGAPRRLRPRHRLQAVGAHPRLRAVPRDRGPARTRCVPGLLP